MATPINSASTSDIWHLSLDDLLAPIQESPRPAGPGPFVINLSASSAPLGQPPKEFAAAAGAHAYQIQRSEDRRPRYRLRLGPFASADEADAMLAIVRDIYPGAFAIRAESEDLRAMAAFKSRPESAPAVITPRAEAPAPAAVAIPVLADPVTPARPAAPARAPAARTATAPSAKPPLGAVTAAPAAKAIPGAAPPAPIPAPRAAAPGSPPPDLESTQTVRALTPPELQDSAARWYVVQLSLSGQSFDPDSLPNLDIFNEYRLYSVAGLDQGRIVHALRLGFFAEEGAAAAVASYLGAFYDHPTVKRISVAERERFRDQRVEARKDIGATGKHTVIEITGERHVREKRTHIATVTPLAPPAALAQSMATPARRRK